MRTLGILVALSTMFGGVATADTLEVAAGVNPPFRWQDGNDGQALAGSLYVGWGGHHAIRANLARWDNTGASAGLLVTDILGESDGSDAIHTGQITDVGASYLYFPRKLWSGLFLEGGVLVRAKNISVEDDFNSTGKVETDSKTYAGRALAGWSLLMFDHVFVSLSLGFSIGYEHGREIFTVDPIHPMETPPIARDVGRGATSGEAFLRIGGVFR